jgi:hypothetical protein
MSPLLLQTVLYYTIVPVNESKSPNTLFLLVAGRDTDAFLSAFYVVR